MQKLNKYSIFILLVFFSFSILRCQNQQTKLIGFWENDKKIMEFNKDYFVIYNKDSSDIVAFKGNYSFAENPSYAIKMIYEEYLDANGTWISLNGTELENYTDTLLIKIDDDSLETKVLGNGQMYSYNRTQNPMNISR